MTRTDRENVPPNGSIGAAALDCFTSFRGTARCILDIIILGTLPCRETINSRPVIINFDNEKRQMMRLIRIRGGGSHLPRDTRVLLQHPCTRYSSETNENNASTLHGLVAQKIPQCLQ